MKHVIKAILVSTILIAAATAESMAIALDIVEWVDLRDGSGDSEIVFKCEGDQPHETHRLKVDKKSLQKMPVTDILKSLDKECNL